jgi:cyclin-dependent kinase
MVLGKALFPGKTESIQLLKIFQYLGTPTLKDWPGMKGYSNSTKLLNDFDEEYEPIDWKKAFPTLDSNGIDLLSKMLQYDPAKRISATDALKHPFFDDYLEDVKKEGLNQVENQE